MRKAFLLTAAAVLLGSCGPVLAQDTGDCSGFKWAVDRETKSFADFKLPEVAVGAPLPSLSSGVRLKLNPQSDARFEVGPTHIAKNDPAFGGVFPLPDIKEAGTYQVTLSDDAWIDVVQNSKLIKQTGFTGSHTCKTVRKSVQFPLDAGPASVEISDSMHDAVKIDVVPVAK